MSGVKLPGDANLLESSKPDILGSPWGGSHNSPQPKRIFRKESHMLPPGGGWKEGAYQLGIKLQVAMLRICLHRFYIYIYKHINISYPFMIIQMDTVRISETQEFLSPKSWNFSLDSRNLMPSTKKHFIMPRGCPPKNLQKISQKGPPWGCCSSKACKICSAKPGTSRKKYHKINHVLILLAFF